MKRTKQVLSLALMLILTLTLAACGGRGDAPSGEDAAAPPTTQSPVATPTPSGGNSDSTNTSKPTEDTPDYKLSAATGDENNLIFRLTVPGVKDSYEIQGNGRNEGWSIRFGEYLLDVATPRDASAATPSEFSAQFMHNHSSVSEATVNLSFLDKDFLIDIALQAGYSIELDNTEEFEVVPIEPTDSGGKRYRENQSVTFANADVVKPYSDVKPHGYDAVYDWSGTYVNGAAEISIVNDNGNLVLYISKNGTLVHEEWMNVGHPLEPGVIGEAGHHDDPMVSRAEYTVLELSEDFQAVTLSVYSLDDSLVGEYKRQ